MKRVLALFALSILAVAAFAGDPPPAKEVLATAQSTAKKEGKTVMVIFHASWCGWCKKLDAFLADKDMAAIMEKNFVITHLDVLENGDKKADENSGGEAVMEELGGKEAGLPFTAVVAADGTLLMNSNEKDKPGTNIGYPAAPNEIGHFMAMLKKGAPKMSAADQAKIQTWLTANAPKTH